VLVKTRYLENTFFNICAMLLYKMFLCEDKV
jgi:hypothetical protein